MKDYVATITLTVHLPAPNDKEAGARLDVLVGTAYNALRAKNCSIDYRETETTCEVNE